MELFLPNNLFTKLLQKQIKTEDVKFRFYPAAELSKFLKANSDSLALVPTYDLLTNREFYVSSKVGVSFEGNLSNSYIYFDRENETVEQLYLKGDVSSLEIILAKILFKEVYNLWVETILLSPNSDALNKNLVVTGDENFVDKKFLSGISFAEEVTELVSAPFVNYILVSNNETLLKKGNDLFLPLLEKSFEKGMHIFENNDIPENSLTIINENLKKVFFYFDEQDVEGIQRLINFPFYHGIIKELFEIRFV